MTLKTLLRLQLAYYALGMLFNAGSIYSLTNGQQQWSPNDPYFGGIAMTIYALMLIPGFLKKIPFYRILMGLAVVLLGYGGVIAHIPRILNTPETYCCTAAMIIGPCINVFGLILNIWAASGRFQLN